MLLSWRGSWWAYPWLSGVVTIWTAFGLLGLTISTRRQAGWCVVMPISGVLLYSYHIVKRGALYGVEQGWEAGPVSHQQGLVENLIAASNAQVGLAEDAIKNGAVVKTVSGSLMTPHNHQEDHLFLHGLHQRPGAGGYRLHPRDIKEGAWPYSPCFLCLFHEWNDWFWYGWYCGPGSPLVCS